MMAIQTPSAAVIIRCAKPEDAEACGLICYKAFHKINSDHNFPPEMDGDIIDRYIPVEEHQQGIQNFNDLHRRWSCRLQAELECLLCDVGHAAYLFKRLGRI